MHDGDAGAARRIARRVVLATSVPPLLQVYRGAYRVVAWMAVRIFRRFPAVRAVYLTRGSAKGEILPMVSDIDFLVIHEGLRPRDREELARAYGALSRRTRLLDANIQLMDETWLRRQVEMDDHFRFRFAEGQATWRLVFGRDYVRELPAPAPESLAPGLLAETKVWWSLFAWRLIGGRKRSAETVTRNNVCYKAVSEVLKATDALRGRRLTFDRARALRVGSATLEPEGRRLAERLEALRRRRFRSHDPTVVADTTAFLLRHLDRFYGEFASHPLGRADASREVVVDAPLGEEPFGPGAVEGARVLAAAIREAWGGRLRGARLVTSVAFNVDETVLFLDADPARAPELDLLQRAFRLHREHARTARPRLRLFVRLAGAAFQLDPEDLEKSWQSILWPPANPDAFVLAAAADRCLLGEPLAAAATAAWTPLLRDFLAAEEVAFAELLADPALYKLGDLDFLRVFWKTAQLVAINRAAAGSGPVVCPLTLPAIERALAAQGAPLPADLRPLARAMGAEDTGQAGIAERMPAAIAYLREIRT